MFEFTLPSDPEKTIRINEISVADAIEFSNIDPNFEEEATTLFLEKAQDRETYYDPRLWTGDDRRFALFLYHVNTTKYATVPLTFTCSVCGNEHTVDISLKKILDGYKPITGKNFREFPFMTDGETTRNVIVRPWNGADLETFEHMTYQMRFIETELDENRAKLTPKDLKRLQVESAKARTNANLFYLVSCIDIPSVNEKGTPSSRRPEIMKMVKAMPFARFQEFVERVQGCIKEMEHGLNTSFDNGRVQILVPDVKCDEQPDSPGTLLRWPFRFVEVIPTL